MAKLITVEKKNHKFYIANQQSKNIKNIFKEICCFYFKNKYQLVHSLSTDLQI